MKAELDALEKAFETPEHPVAAIVGGAKISTKLDLLGHLLPKVETLIIGGGMANTFLAAQGKAIGKSLCENRSGRECARYHGQGQVAAPRDRAAGRRRRRAEAGGACALSRVVPADEVGAADMILDIGPRSVEQVISVLARTKTLVWNGPFGAFEHEPFDNGTIEVAEAVAELTTAGRLVSFAGGGDTVAALNLASVTDRLTHVSTAGRRLPGIPGGQDAAGREGTDGIAANRVQSAAGSPAPNFRRAR